MWTICYCFHYVVKINQPLFKFRIQNLHILNQRRDVNFVTVVLIISSLWCCETTLFFQALILNPAITAFTTLLLFYSAGRDGNPDETYEYYVNDSVYSSVGPGFKTCCRAKAPSVLKVSYTTYSTTLCAEYELFYCCMALYAEGK